MNQGKIFWHMCGQIVSLSFIPELVTLVRIMLSWKVALESQIAFAVEAVAASQVRDLAQEVRRWQGRVFLPLLHAVGLGSLAGAKEAGSPGVLVMELADCTLKEKKFEGEALIMVAWALASTLALLNEAGFSQPGSPFQPSR